MYSATLLALHPGAAHQRMFCCSSQGISRWSVPAVAVPMNWTGVPARSSALMVVLDRTISASVF